MEVNCEFLDERTTASTKTIAESTINATGAGNFTGRFNNVSARGYHSLG